MRFIVGITVEEGENLVAELFSCYFASVKLVNLEAALQRRPFRPFELRIDGEVILLRHPEQAMFAEGKSTLLVVDPDDHWHVLDVDQISKLRFLPPQKPATKNGKH